MLGWDELGIAINKMAQGVDLEGMTVSFFTAWRRTTIWHNSKQM